MSEDGDSKFVKIIEFPDRSPLFAKGFEAGVVWAYLLNDAPIQNVMVSDENHDFIQTMCGHFGKLATFAATESPVWFCLTVSPRIVLVSENTTTQRSTTNDHPHTKSTTSLLRLLPSPLAPTGGQPADR